MLQERQASGFLAAAVCNVPPGGIHPPNHFFTFPVRPVLTLRIPQPCAQPWAALTPTAAGRHCAACQKTVVDFSQLTDAEILAVLARAPGETCGRLRPDQLGRPLRPLLLPAPSRWRAWLAAAVALWGLREMAGENAHGQAPATVQPAVGRHHAGPIPDSGQPTPGLLPAVAEPRPANPVSGTHDAPAAAPARPPQCIGGTVRDAQTGNGLPGITVRLTGTDIDTATDANGSFELQIPPGARSPVSSLEILAIGYVAQQVPVPAAPNGYAVAPVRCSLQADTTMLGGMGVTVACKRPWPWHPRALYRWTKFRLLNLFK